MAQDAGFEIFQPAVEVDEVARLILRQGVDGEIPPPQILFQSNGRLRMDHEAPIAGGGFALRAGEGVFLLGFRMEEDRKILPHRLKALG